MPDPLAIAAHDAYWRVKEVGEPPPFELQSPKLRQCWEAAARAVAAAEREACAQHLEALAANYPPDIFPPNGTSRDAIGGSAMRHALTNAARSLREDELRKGPPMTVRDRPREPNGRFTAERTRNLERHAGRAGH